MTAKELQAQIEFHVEAIEKLMNDNMVQKGNMSWECHKTNMQNLLNSFSHSVNGIDKEDLKK